MSIVLPHPTSPKRYIPLGTESGGTITWFAAEFEEKRLPNHDDPELDEEVGTGGG